MSSIRNITSEMQIKDAIFQGSRELFKEAPIRNIPVGIDWPSPSRILKRDPALRVCCLALPPLELLQAGEGCRQDNSLSVTSGDCFTAIKGIA